jgi:5-methyltetrahydropteroyltriglutamate--homocysteine methyltransferase
MVGSYPMPGWLGRRTVEPHSSGVVWNLTGAQLDEAKRDAVVLALRDQELAGLDIVTDGEQTRPGYATHFTRRLAGFDYEQLGFKWKSGGRWRAEVGRITGPVAWREPVTTEELRFLKGATRHRVKTELPGTMTIIDSALDTHYGDERALAFDLATAINAEARALEAGGCDVIQLDEPVVSRYPDKLADWGLAALDRCLAGLSSGTRTRSTPSSPTTWPSMRRARRCRSDLPAAREVLPRRGPLAADRGHAAESGNRRGECPGDRRRAIDRRGASGLRRPSGTLPRDREHS